MKRTQLLIMCLLTVATIFLNAACSGKPPPTSLKEKPSFICSHEVGLIVRPGESIHLTYKAASESVDLTLICRSNRIELDYYSGSINVPIQFATTGDKTRFCWGKDNCFVAAKNRDGSWTIESLPFGSSK